MKRLKAKSGKALEETLSIVHREYQKRKIATIHKCEPPTITLSKAGNRKTIYLLNPYLDFVGCLATGRMIVMEAKSTEDNHRLAISQTGGGLSGAQYGAGCRWADFGALVGITWQFGQKTVWIPWRVVREAVESGARSMTPEQGFAIPAGIGFIMLDWIKVALLTEKC